MYQIYTDGACSGNRRGEGYGGYAALILNPDDKRIAVCGSLSKTTNNVMEIYSAIVGLKKVHQLENYDTSNTLAIVISDSKYLVEGWNNYLIKWLDRNWQTASGSEVANQKMWSDLFTMVCQFKCVKFNWVKGHADDKHNKFVDGLAQKESKELKKRMTSGDC